MLCLGFEGASPPIFNPETEHFCFGNNQTLLSLGWHARFAGLRPSVEFPVTPELNYV
jgi:hypothetical protein